jgi:hypothetical protein
MKLSHITLAACAALAGGNAMALSAAATQAVPPANRLYISGSSALQSVIEGLLNPQNCVAGTYNRYKGLAGSPAGSGDTNSGSSHNAYSCTIKTGSDIPSFDGQDIVIIKREAGGSVQGVFPLLAGAAPIAMIDLASCTDSGANAFTCNATANVTPQAGVSDLEPAAFTYTVNQPSAFLNATLPSSPFRSSSSVAEQVFALIVSDTLFNDLSTLQGTATPSVGSSAFASLFATGYDAQNLGWTPLGKTLPGATNQVNVCSRGIGSGTRATAQIEFLQLPYNPAAPSVATPTDNTPGSIRQGNIANTKFYSEESSSGQVVSCVGGTAGYAIGIVGADRDLSNTGAHFVNLDNQVPGRATAKEGNYPWVFESFYQVNKNNVASTSTSLLANAFLTAFRKPANINAVTPAAANGVMATPVNCSGTTAIGWTGDELAACSRVSRNKDSRLPLDFVK